MTFEIEGDTLWYVGRPVAKMLTMSLAFRRALEDDIRDYTTADDFEEDHAVALKSEYEEGFEAGKVDERKDWENRLDDEREKLDAKGFEAGHAQGIKDAGFAADAARVEILLCALQEIHNAIQPLWLGVEESGKYKRRAAKTSEVKRAAQNACAAARRALNGYRQE